MKSLFILMLFYIKAVSQTERDHFIIDTIQSKLYKSNLNIKQYEALKLNILKLEKITGDYEPEYKFDLLEQSYKFNDTTFFKNELTILVERYGFQVEYMKETETYFNAIMKNELSKWFKKMYIQKHSVWLQNNFDKQIPLRKLNELNSLDQRVSNFYAGIDFKLNPSDSITKSNIKTILFDDRFQDAKSLIEIVKNINAYPTAKSFALIQNPFLVIELHNYQSKQYFKQVWDSLYPYYKKSYLSNQITFNKFKDHDYLSLKHYGYQKFGLIKSVEEIPEWLRGNIKDVPIFDIEEQKINRKEFKWY